MFKRFQRAVSCGLLLSVVFVASELLGVESPSLASSLPWILLCGGLASLGMAALFGELVVLWRAWFLRGRELSPETQQEIRGILAELGFNKPETVTLFECAPVGGKLYPRHGALSLLSLIKGRQIALTSQEAFNQLGRDEKRFLIGHEAVHIMRRHVLKMVIFAAFGAWLVTMPLFFLVPLYMQGSPWYLLFGLNMAIGYLVMGIAFFASMYISRANERQADREGARFLNAADGGVALMKRFKEDPVMQKVVVAYTSKWRQLLLPHPSLDERIALLEGEMR